LDRCVSSLDGLDRLLDPGTSSIRYLFQDPTAHPTAGHLSFDIEIVAAPHDPHQRLVIYTAEQDSPTARLLPLLASWDLDPGPRSGFGQLTR
jgi:MmyB-like transcription regulator ligand binding domain